MQVSQHSGERLSKATLYSTLSQLKRFFQWLAGQPGYKSRIHYSDAEYFNLSEKEARIATARRDGRIPTIEQIKHVLKSMPTDSEIDRRNRALVAFTLLTGTRDRATVSLKLKHVDIAAGSVFQDAREVQTKFSKTFITTFFPVGDEIRAIVEEWVTHLRQVKLWGNDDPLFPATDVIQSPNRRFEVAGLKRKHWASAGPIRDIFRKAFEGSGLPYFNPHSFRKTIGHLGETICQTPEEFKAWSQNLGHEGVMTTFRSYGEVASKRQAEIIKNLAKPQLKIDGSIATLIQDEFRKLREAFPDNPPG